MALFYHATPAEALSEILKSGLKPRIGPRSNLMGETIAAVYIFDDPDMLDDAIGGWLGDAFEDQGITELAVLSVDLDIDTLGASLSHDGLSHACTRRIAPEVIRVLRMEPLDV
ncbi:hypothetical protein ACOI1H_16120 [Loktanella sp. DJP18]|uniref:hypothetical protein n=1 Tax=Loktanella sp. DJP18 TaxID=3409788 RepID=UPI003BB58D10